MAFISPSLSSNSGDSLLATPVDPADTEKETADSRVLSQYPLDPPKLTECSGMVVSPGTTPIAKPRGLAVTVLKEEEELSTDTSVGTLETSEHEVPWKEHFSWKTKNVQHHTSSLFHQHSNLLATKTSPFETSDTAPANTSTSEDAFSSQASLIRGPAAEKTSSGSVRSMGYSMSQKSPTFEKESMTLTTESSATSQEARPEPHPAPAVSSADRGSSRQFRPPSPGSELSMTSTFFGTSPPSSCRSASPKGSFKHQPAVRVSPVKPLTDPPEAQRRKSPGRSPKASLIGKTFSGATVSELKVLLEKQRKSTKERGSETPRPVTDKANDLIKTSTEPPKTSFLRMLVNDDETGAERHEKHGRSHDGENKLNIGNANNTAFERVNKNTGGLPLPLEHVTTSVYQKRVNVDGQPPSSKVTITQKKVRYTAEPVGANLEPAPGEQSPPKILTLPPSSHKSLPQPTPIVPVTTGRAAQPSPGFTSVQRTRSEEEEQALRQPAPPSFEGQEMPGEAKVIGTSPRHSGHPSPHKQVIMDMLAFGHNPKAYVPPSPQRHPGGRSPGRSPQMYPNVRGGVNSLPPQVIPSPPSSRAESAGISMTTPEERARILAATRNKKRLSPRPGSAPYPTGVRDQTDRHPAREKRYPGREQPSRQPVAEVYYPSSGEDRWSTEALYPVSDQDQVVRQPVLGTYYPGSDKDAGVRQPVVGDHSLLGRREPSPAHARKMDILSRPPRFPMLNAHSSGDSSEDFSDFFAKYLDETQKRISPPRSPKKHLTSPARSPRSARSPQRVKTASPSPQSSKRRPPDPYERLRRAFEKRQRNLTQIVKLPDISENNLAGSSRRSESEGRRVTPTTSPGWSPYPSNVVVYPGMNPHPQPFGHQLHAYRHRQGLIGDSSELLASVRSPPYPQPVNAPYSDVARDRSRRKQGRRVSWNDDHNRLTERQRLVESKNQNAAGTSESASTAVENVEFSQRRTQTKQCTVRQNETTTHASTEQMQRRHFRHSQDLTLDTQEQRMQKEYTFQDRRQRVSMLEERQQSQEYILKKSPRTALFSEQRVAPNATSTTSQSSDGPYAVQAKRADNNQNRAWSSSESLSDVEQPGENQMEESPVKGNPLSLSEELRNAGWSPGGLPSKEPPAQGDQVVSGNVRTVEFEEWTDEEGSLPCDCLPGNHLHDVNESANSSSRLGKDNGSSCEDECVNWDSRFYTPKDITGDTAIGAGSDETSRHHHVKMSTKTWRRKRVVRREQDEEDGNVQYYSLEAHDDLRGGCTDSHNGSRHGTTPRRRRRHRNDDNDNINNSGNDNPGNTPYKTIPNDTAVEYPLPHKVTDDPCKGEVAGAIGGTSPHESTRRHGSLGALSSYPRTKPTMLRKRRSFGRSYLSRIMSRRQGDDSDGHGSGAVGHQKPSCRTKSEDYTERPHASNTNRRGGLDICHECGPVPGDSRASEFLPAQKGLYAQAAYDRASGLVYFNTHTDGECACTVVDVNATRGLHDRRFIPRAFTEETVRYEDQNDENDNFSQSSSQAEHEERCERDEDRTDSISSYEVGEVWGSSQQSSQSSVPSAYSDDVHCKLHEEAYNPERGDGDVDRGFYKEREALTKGACVMDEKGRQKEASSYSTAESQACEPSETCPPDENFSRATYTASPVSGKSSANARGPSTFTVTESMVQAYGYNPLTVSPFTARGYPRLAHDESNLDHVTVPFVKRKALIFLRSDKQEFVEVGRGTYGCVYLAQATTRRGTAKVVVKDFFTDSTTWELIVHEARMLSYLQDTGVIPHFYGLLKRRSLGDDYSLIMQYFGQGKTLHTALVNKEDLPALIWQDVAWQLARGLLLIHERHVLLNDLKGDNVLIDMRRERKVIKYIDLGMATYRKGLNFHLPEDQMSKFNFLAPEVRAGAFTSPMSDVYSLGYLLDQINRLAKLQALHETSQKCMDDLPADRPHLPLVVEALQIQSDVLADAAAAEAMN
ncbi:hypothetical protein BaRGS_00014547 [Batillaria attramentaria]|uniref:non-specific serine/threonine protein kinase n=2 Tax=Batillaria attramentaria TaxID=370345 RepID=A0ABD0L4J4_9CAEN